MIKDYLVIGLGKSGICVCDYFTSKNIDFDVCPGQYCDSNIQLARNYENIASNIFFENELEGLNLNNAAIYKTGIICPGIAKTSKLYANAMRVCKSLISELEFAYTISKDRWICITGTNGKTTTTSLITHILNSSGKSAYSCGNIGKCATGAALNQKKDEYLVVEASSFQLTSIYDFAPSIAILLNITPDHLNWHGNMQEYIDDKCKVFKNANENSVAIIDKNLLNFEDLYYELAKRKTRIFVLNSDEFSQCAFCKNGSLYLKDNSFESAICDASELHISGVHNISNSLAASVAAYICDCDISSIKKGLVSFKALEHRLEFVATVKGINFYNDSKATNVDSTIQALTGFADKSIVLLLGGRDKNTSLDELVKACESKCKAVVLYGESQVRFSKAFKEFNNKVYVADDMNGAIECAFKVASTNDNILLSPACASFDEFSGFEQRGCAFKQKVACLF